MRMAVVVVVAVMVGEEAEEEEEGDYQVSPYQKWQRHLSRALDANVLPCWYPLA